MDRVNTMPLPYNDLYIPLGWIDCYRAGVPIFHCQVTTMQNNYPLTWLAFGWLGWGVKDVIWLSVAMEAVLFAALIPVVWQLPRGPVWPFFAILVSPPVFLARERCNIDILIATMMIAAGYFGSAAAFTLITAGFMLKFFPLGAGAVLPALLVAVTQNGWRSWEGSTVAFMIAAFWLTWDFVDLPVAAVQELCCWALFILSVPLLIWSLPEWTVSYLRRGATR
jgi:hypothetical protein